ncbi:MAG: ADP-glyceromanno-heptose 6-epimerase [Lentisphaerae bacterium GWF2_44_16]|nr:MAG: ADP-glyceromanno-heptose 6-epimerase [Lentisphaerae bacterium GWF2_44_16]
MHIVTGGAGLIGSAIVWGLNKLGIEDILLVDHLGTSEKWKNLRALKFSDYIEKDVFRKLIADNKISPQTDAIIHMGACSSTTETDASYLMDNNFSYSKELALFSAQHNIKFIYASSAATYGDGSMGYSDDEASIEKLRPLNIYGYSKQIFDLWALRKGLFKKITGLKFFNVFGPNELHKKEMRSMVCRSFEQIMESSSIRLFKSANSDYADGEQKRDFLYVKDAVGMVLFLLENQNSHGIFNIGSGKAETWNSLAEAAFSAMNIKSNIIYIDMPETLKGRYQNYTKAEMQKLYSLGYNKPVSSLNEAVKDYILNYLAPEKNLGD